MPVFARALVLVTAWLMTWFDGSAQPARKPAAPDPFTIGLLRRDGIVTPFAAFDGREWTSPWPADLRIPKVPESLGTVPAKWWGKPGPFEAMTLWVSGERRGQVRIERPASVRIRCSPRVGLRSDYVSALPVPPPASDAFPKDGVVVSGAAVVEPIAAVPQVSPEWAASALLLVEPFDGAETAAAGAFTDWKHPFPRSERRKVPVALEALYKAPMDAEGWTAYRFQAVKRYPPLRADGNCGLISSATGWIMQGPEGQHWTELAARVTYCDRMDDIFTVPFGLVRAGGKSYWIYELSGYDREGYAVTRPTPRAVETPVQYAAGSCPT